MASLSAEKLEQTISAFCRIANVLESSPDTLQAVPVSLIQQACSLLDIITSHMPIPATLDASVPHTELTQCSNAKQLECVLSLMLKIVSGKEIFASVRIIWICELLSLIFYNQVWLCLIRWFRTYCTHKLSTVLEYNLTKSVLLACPASYYGFP